MGHADREDHFKGICEIYKANYYSANGEFFTKHPVKV